MKTGKDVHKAGLYASDCCLKEVTFQKDASFSRCPQCLGLCEWEPVEVAVSEAKAGRPQSIDLYEAA
jgi:hypothetical protein